MMCGNDVVLYGRVSRPGGDQMRRPKVLYIEDNEFNRVLVKRVLTVEDMEVIEASDGAKGLELALAHHPDLILVDINLPDIDGYELTLRIKGLGELRDIPIVALTANVMKGDKEKTLDAGCDGYIQKPVDVDRLPDQVRSFMKGT
jgi:two-component system cell cycle response regulator DivK